MQHKRIRTALTVAIILAALPVQAAPAMAQGEKSSDIYAAEFHTAKLFQQALKVGDRQGVARLIRYPLPVWDFPLPRIATQADFIANWDDYFDAANSAALIAAKPGEMGSHGVVLGNKGDVWFDGGKISGINARTKTFAAKWQAAKTRDESALYPTARGYKRVAISCSMPNKSIRIQEHADGFHYFVWKKSESVANKPQLALTGTEEFQGTSGGVTYTFTNAGYRYVFDAPTMCEGPVCHDTMTVSKDGKDLSSQICR